MSNLNLEFATSDDFGGNITNISMIRYVYDKYGLQMYDDLSYNLNFSVFDLENLENRSATYSKTLKLPGTSVNNAIFSNLYDIDVDIITDYKESNFTDDIFFGKKINCELLYDTIPVKEGFFELKKVYYNEGLRNIEYEGEFYSKSKSFTENVGDKLLYGNEDIGDDLSFSEYDHIFNMENFVGSHSGNYYDNSVGYYYPIIDYMNTESGNMSNMENYRPSIYVKEIVDKIFSQAGYSYSSTFFDSELFKSLVIPWTGAVALDDEDLELRRFNVGMEYVGATHTDYTGDGDIVWGNYSPWGYVYKDFYNDAVERQGEPSKPTVRKIPLDKDGPDPYYNSAGDDFSASNNQWTVPAKGKYRLSWTSTQNVYGIWWRNNTGSLGQVAQQGDKNVEITMQFKILRNNSTRNEVLSVYKMLKNMPFVAGDTWIPTWTDTMNWSGKLEQGDKVWCEISLNNKNAWTPTDGSTGNVNVRLWLNVINVQSFDIVAEPGSVLYYGEKVEMRKALPKDTGQMDFFKDIINMFNLVVDEYPNTDNKLIVEKRDDYYYSGVTLDWTNKEDISQSEEIERIPTLINKDFKLSYKEDKDDYNVLYEEDNRGLIYGNHKVKNPYLSNDTYNVEIDFSPTPLGEFGYTNWAVSKIFTTNDRGEVQDQEFENKILYRQNIDAKSQPNVPNGWLLPHNIYFSGTSAASFGYTQSGGVDYEYQPYAGHLDNPYNPTLDLNFGLCNNYYYPYLPDSMTVNNIYHVYWSNYVAELMDLNSKKVTKYLKLDTSDIYQLSFSSKIWIDGVVYVLDKIIDWNPGQITKVELLKLSKYDLDLTGPADYKKSTTYKKKLVDKKKRGVIDLQQAYSIDLNQYQNDAAPSISGGTESNFTGTTIKAEYVSRENRYAEGTVGLIIGDSNVVEASTMFIKGDNNIISSGSTDITIFGNNIEIAEGASGVVVLGNDVAPGETHTKISKSNYVYLPSGYTIENHYTIEQTDDIFDSERGTTSRANKSTQLYTSGVEDIIGNTYSGAGSVVTLSTAQTTDGKVYTIMDELGTADVNNIIINTESTQVINGLSSWTIDTKYGGVSIYSDGTNWFVTNSN